MLESTVLDRAFASRPAAYRLMNMMKWRVFLLSSVLAVSTGAIAGAPITGAGSTAAQPLYGALAKAYAAGGGPALDYQAVGSSAGIVKIRERSVAFAASDVAMNAEQLDKDKLVCFPSAISGVAIVANVPGVGSGDLRLTGELLADIFARKITKWNDAALVAVNPGLRLPALPIVVIVRSDGSGTTYNFTDYLAAVSPEWRKTRGRDFKVAWPADTIAVKGSGDVAKTVKDTRGAIAYIDFRYAVESKLATAKLRNRDGLFVAPTPEGFALAVKNSAWTTQAKFEETLTDKPGASTWPITAGTFVLVPRATATPEQTIAALKFFMWSFVNGDKLTENASFVRLPDRVQGRVFGEVTKITDSSGQPLRWSLTSALQSKP